MRYQDQVIRMTEAAYQALFQTARAVPVEKLKWKPCNTSRNILSQLQECALVPLSYAAMLNTRAEHYEPHHCPEAFAQAQANFSQLTTVEACQEACGKHTQILLEVIRLFPEEEINNCVRFSNPGIAISTFADVMALHYWNCVYHTGQINYIQTCYDDFKIH